MKARVAAACLVLAVLACERERREEFPAIPVQMEVAKRAEFAPTLALLGVVRAAHTIPLEAISGGNVVYARRFAGGLQTGVRVTRGETIATLTNEQVGFQRTQSRLQMEAALAEFDRAKRSFEQGVVSQAEYNSRKVAADLAREQYAAATRESGRLSIVAPESGTLVVAKPFPPGVHVAAGTILAEISSGGAPIIESAVAAADRALLRPGLVVTFGEGRGKIAEVASVIDAAGTARVVATIDGGTVPPPGSGVELKVELDRRPDVLTVPEEAIVASGDGPAVFIASMSAEGYRTFSRVKRVAVELGGRSNGRVEIVSGVRDGDRVVVSGADALSDSALVSDAGAK
jgi:multidrug efflux system membrane fusion protein